MKLYNIQFLRGISALLVCCFHFKDAINFQNLAIGDFLFKKGSIGVPIFFVISGFIITHTTKNLTFDLNTWKNIKQFLIKRIIRIVPLYYFLTIMWIILGATISYYFVGSGLSRLWHSFLFLPENNQFPILYLGWSLNFEMYFYFIFAISFLFKKYRFHFVFIFFILCILLGHILPINYEYWKMMSSTLNLYFLIGIIFSLIMEKIRWKRTTIIYFTSFCIATFSLFLTDWVPQITFVFQFILISSLVLSFLLFDTKLTIKPHRFFVYLGDISFSLYLSHPFIEILMRRFQVAELFQIPFFIFKIAIVILVSCIIYELVEKRFTKYLKYRLL